MKINMKKKKQVKTEQENISDSEKDIRRMVTIATIIFCILVVGTIIVSLVRTGELERLITDSKATYIELTK